MATESESESGQGSDRDRRADAPRRIVERNIIAAGRRLAHGTYTIEPLRTGGSHVAFTYA
ncbi:hypothetical protein ACWGI9_10835 [Streptomyces sp. NPDC054833]